MVVERKLDQNRWHLRIYVGVDFAEIGTVKPQTVLFEPLLEKRLFRCQYPVVDKIREIDASGSLFACNVSGAAVIVAVVNVCRDPLSSACIRVERDVERIIVVLFVFPCRVTAPCLDVIVTVIRRNLIDIVFRRAEELNVRSSSLLPARFVRCFAVADKSSLSAAESDGICNHYGAAGPVNCLQKYRSVFT